MSSIDYVTSLVTDKSRVMILNYSNNPKGSVLFYDKIDALSKIAAERDLIVISNEVYKWIVSDSGKHYHLAEFPGVRERTLVVDSFFRLFL